MHKFNSKIAAAAGTRHVETLDELNRLGVGLGEDLGFVGSVLHAVARAPIHERYAVAVKAVQRSYAEMFRELLRRLGGMAQRQHGVASAALVKHFPARHLSRVPAQRRRLTERGPDDLISNTISLTLPRFRRVKRGQQSPHELLRELILPDLAPARVRQLVLGGDDPAQEQATIQRIAQQTKLADPLQVANVVVTNYSQGKDRTETARALRPMLNNNRAAARRVARTEGARVANAANMEAYEQLGDMVIGYQIHAVLDERTRPEHRQRNGRIYYKHPGPDQHSVQEMPNPPQEADGSVAPFCRCWLSPVFADATSGEPALDFTNDSGRVIPDPVTYDQWFRDADERLRRQAVGAKRYRAVEERYEGRKPDYMDFARLDGSLLTPDEIAAESEKVRQNRRNSLVRMFSQHRLDRISVLATGQAAAS